MHVAAASRKLSFFACNLQTMSRTPVVSASSIAIAGFFWAFHGPLAACCATTANLFTSGSGGRDDKALSPMRREIRARSLDALSHRADHSILLKEM